MSINNRITKKPLLKGLMLYNLLISELGKYNRSKKGAQQLSIASKRKIVSEQLYPKFKTDPKQSIRAIRADIRGLIGQLPPKDVCNPLLLPEEYLAAVEFYEIDNHIKNFLPDCLDVRVNAGYIGQTKIFNTRSYNYYSDGVAEMVQQIREEVSNSSGSAYFYGIVKLKNNKKNDGTPFNYFVDYVLTINEEPQDILEGVEYKKTKREEKKSQNINTYFSERFKNLQKEKKQRARKSKAAIEKKPENIKINESIKTAIESLKQAYKAGAFTKDQFEALRDELRKRKK
jgi:hypothetical protein